MPLYRQSALLGLIRSGLAQSHKNANRRRCFELTHLERHRSAQEDDDTDRNSRTRSAAQDHKWRGTTTFDRFCYCFDVAVWLLMSINHTVCLSDIMLLVQKAISTRMIGLQWSKWAYGIVLLPKWWCFNLMFHCGSVYNFMCVYFCILAFDFTVYYLAALLV